MAIPHVCVCVSTSLAACDSVCTFKEMEQRQKKHQKGRIRWDSDEERKLIELWADILQELDGKMVTRKKKEEAATRHLNEYVEKELGKTTVFSEEVKNKIDWMLKKGKQFYSIYQKKGETGRTTGEHEVDLDLGGG